MSTIDQYVSAATRDNTRRSYQSAIRHFEETWGGFLPVFWAFLAAIAAGTLGALVGGPAAPRPDTAHAGA